jgi:hypothetical protein
VGSYKHAILAAREEGANPTNLDIYLYIGRASSFKRQGHMILMPPMGDVCAVG